MTDKDAMKLAIEALEGVLDDAPKVLDASISGGLYEVVQCRDAITALKERLADPMREVQRLGQEIEQEPVAWMDVDGNFSDNNDHKCFPIPLYTQPPQRTWVGLKEEDVFAVIEKLQNMYHRPPSAIFAQAIEAKLKEKNQ